MNPPSGVAVVGVSAWLPAGHDLRSAWQGLALWAEGTAQPPIPESSEETADSLLGSLVDRMGHLLPSDQAIPLLLASREGAWWPGAGPVTLEVHDKCATSLALRALDILEWGHADAVITGGADATGCVLLALRRAEDALRLGLPVLAMLHHVEAGTPAGLVDRRSGVTVAPRSVGLTLLQGDPGSSPPWEAPRETHDRLPWCALLGCPHSPGHGAADLLVALLAVHDRALPPGRAEDVVSLLGEGSPFVVHNRLQPWIHGLETPRRALVGPTDGGTPQSWLMVEAPATAADDAPPTFTASWPSELLALDGDTIDEVRAKASRLLGLLETPEAGAPCFLADLAATCAQACGGRRHRLALLARSTSELKSRLDTALRKLGDAPTVRVRDALFYADTSRVPPQPVAWLFPGQGAQYAGMGAETALYFAPVRAWFDRYEEHQHELGALPVASIVAPPGAGLDDACQQAMLRNLQGMEGGAQAGFLLSLALDELLGALRIPRTMVVGNSNGENAALIASGRLDLDRPALFRLMARLKSRSADEDVAASIPYGVALAVSLSDRTVLDRLLEPGSPPRPGQLFLALDNCPHQVVLFGDEPGIAHAEECLRNAGALCLRLPFFERGYHTPLFEKCALEMRDLYDDFTIAPGRVPVYSCATAGPFPPHPEAVRDLAALLWARPVLFRQTIERVFAEGARSFVEVGPGGKLVGFVRDILRDHKDVTIVASNVENRSELLGLQALAGHFFAQGHDIDLGLFFAHRPVRVLPPGPGDPPGERRTTPPAAESSVFREVAETSNPAPVAPSSHASAESGVTGPAPADTAAPAPVAPSSHASADSKVTGTARADTAAPTPVGSHPADARGRILQEHFGLMCEFLDHQARMCLGLFGSGLACATAGSGSAPVMAAPARQAPPPPALPAWQEHFEDRRVLDLSRDLFLLDHTLGRRPADRRDLPSPLPVMPFTFSMEMLAEAARQLSGGTAVVTGLRNVRGRRWLALDTGRLELAITAHLLPGPTPTGEREAHVQIEEMPAEGHGPRFLAFDGIVRLGSGYSAPPPPLEVELDARATPKWSVQEFYRTCLFHGPTLQALHRLRGLGSDCIEADLRVPSTDGLFRGHTSPHLEIPAPTLDAALQMIGYWLVEQGREFFGVFPFSIGSYRQYAPSVRPGTALICRGRLERSDDVAHGDFDFIDADSMRVVARLEDVRSRYFAYPPPYLYSLYWPGPTTFLARPWVESASRLLCWRIDFLTAEFLDDGWGIWKRALAHVLLGEREQEEWNSLPAAGPTRTRWLLERAAAKDAARSWFQEHEAPIPAPSEIELARTPSGTLRFSLLTGTMPAPPPHLAVACDECRSIASAIPPGMNLGIDVARQDVPSATDDDLDEHEERLLSSLAPLARQAARCARRAALRAVGTGTPRLASLSPDLGRAEVRADAWGAVTLAVDLERDDHDILATCLVPTSVAETLRPA